MTNRIIKAAFQAWADKSRLSFTKVEGRADIDIRWASTGNAGIRWVSSTRAKIALM